MASSSKMYNLGEALELLLQSDEDSDNTSEVQTSSEEEQEDEEVADPCYRERNMTDSQPDKLVSTDFFCCVHGFQDHHF